MVIGFGAANVYVRLPPVPRYECLPCSAHHCHVVLRRHRRLPPPHHAHPRARASRRGPPQAEGEAREGRASRQEERRAEPLDRRYPHRHRHLGAQRPGGYSSLHRVPARPRPRPAPRPRHRRPQRPRGHGRRLPHPRCVNLCIDLSVRWTVHLGLHDHTTHCMMTAWRTLRSHTTLSTAQLAHRTHTRSPPRRRHGQQVARAQVHAPLRTVRAGRRAASGVHVHRPPERVRHPLHAGGGRRRHGAHLPQGAHPQVPRGAHGLCERVSCVPERASGVRVPTVV